MAQDGTLVVPLITSCSSAFCFSPARLFFGFFFFLLSSIINCPAVTNFDGDDEEELLLDEPEIGLMATPFARATAASTRYAVVFRAAFNSSIRRSELIQRAPAFVADMRSILSLLATIKELVIFPSVTCFASKHRSSMYASADAPTPENTTRTPKSVTFFFVVLSLLDTAKFPGPSPNGPLVSLPKPSNTHSIRQPFNNRNSSKSCTSVSRALLNIPLFIHFFNLGH
mmetsp:Transcript_38109/g.57021  ORF Transcript_38109/g.57021 Transcript_38109/m.57021 type:complete len:227 (+) Transcript_38109:116-796(+)